MLWSDIIRSNSGHIRIKINNYLTFWNFPGRKSFSVRIHTSMRSYPRVYYCIHGQTSPRRLQSLKCFQSRRHRCQIIRKRGRYWRTGNSSATADYSRAPDSVIDIPSVKLDYTCFLPAGLCSLINYPRAGNRLLRPPPPQLLILVITLHLLLLLLRRPASLKLFFGLRLILYTYNGPSVEAALSPPTSNPAAAIKV